MQHPEGNAVWRELIYRGVESDELDYKAAMDWNALPHSGRAKLVRHCLAFANTHGGHIVIGVGEDASGHPSDYQGLNARQLHSFDPSAVIAFINRQVDPPIDMTIERPMVDGKHYAVMAIRPFSTLPHVCASGMDNELQQGVFYIRTKGASSRPAVSALEMQSLLQRALRNQRALLGQMLRGILYEAWDRTSSGELAERRFQIEKEQYLRYIAQHLPASDAGIRLDLFARPQTYDETRCSLKRLRRGARMCIGPVFPEKEMESLYSVNTALRSLEPASGRAAEFFQSGLVCRTLHWPESGFSCAEIRRQIADCMRFLGNFYSGMDAEDDMLEIIWCIPQAKNLCMHWPGGASGAFSGESAQAALTVSLAELTEDPERAAERLFRMIGEAFLLPPRFLNGSAAPRPAESAARQ